MLHMLDQHQLARTLLPIGHLDKPAVRTGRRFGLRTAIKPDSQDVCFITSTGGRQESSAGASASIRPSRERDGTAVGTVDAVEMVTVGQRRGLGLPGGGPKRFVLDVRAAGPESEVVVGDEIDR